jgi:signal peptidase I
LAAEGGKMSDSIGSEKLRRPIIALVLSILTVGLGQIYSTRPRRGMLFYAAFLWLRLLFVSTPILRSLAGLVVLIVVAGCFLAVHLSDAWRTAKRVGVVTLRPYNHWFVYFLIVAVNLAVVTPLVPKVVPQAIKAYRVPTSAMEPALRVGDLFMADRHLDRTELKRGDIVVFWHPTERKDFIKRVIGLPGETVETRGEQVLINGRVLDDPWGVYRGSASNLDAGPVLVPPGAYFLMGDNRTNSWDSRAWGCLRADFINAKALYIYWARDKSRIGKPVQ